MNFNSLIDVCIAYGSRGLLHLRLDHKGSPFHFLLQQSNFIFQHRLADMEKKTTPGLCGYLLLNLVLQFTIKQRRRYQMTN